MTGPWVDDVTEEAPQHWKAAALRVSLEVAQSSSGLLGEQAEVELRLGESIGWTENWLPLLMMVVEWGKGRKRGR